MIVENRGGGFAAIEVVARAIPDGSTLLYYGSILWLLPLMHEKAPYDTQPEVREQLTTNGVEAVRSTPQQFAAKIKAEVARMDKVIRDVGIRVE